MALNSLGIAKPPADTRVVVAMSGGVDSSVTAGLLREQGYEVIGITLQLYDHGQAIARKGACCAGRDIQDARNVADRIDIPHYVLDFESRFRQSVIDDFANDYANGRTPIPCVRCNQRVKFKDLLIRARELGADCLATGHYARIAYRAGRPLLRQAVDASKDQTHFLFATTSAQLDYLRFPLGDFSKDETRSMAERMALPVAHKPDSQDICFVPNGHYSALVAKLRPETKLPGPIKHIDGRILGEHQGIIHFTVGQRRGLKVAVGEPLYVVGIDPSEATVLVGPRDAGLSHSIALKDVNWLPGQPPASEGTPLMIKHRYNEPAVAGRLFASDTGWQVVFDTPEDGVAPGQAAVFYDQGMCLGGGWIDHTISVHQAAAPHQSAVTTQT